MFGPTTIYAVLVGLLVVPGCGRIGFDSMSAPGDSNADTRPDPIVDCVSGDGLCSLPCAGVDTDCPTTCGDGSCDGNAGEVCRTCAADCATKTAVCGNAACDPGEDSICPVDCGPYPWPWGADEATVLADINARRMTGQDCSGGAPPMEAALSLDASMVLAAREWAWDIAQSGLADSCNGRTFQERFGAASSVWYAQGGSPDQGATTLFGNAAICAALMDPSNTFAGVGAAHTATRDIYAVVLR